MSFSYSMIATRLSPADFQRAVLHAWADLEILEGPLEVGDRDQAFEWATPRSEYLEGASPEDVKLFYRDGEWTILVDLSMTMASDTTQLRALSKEAGRVIVATTQGTAGYASVVVFEEGGDTRSIESVEGDVETAGEPLEEEAGLDLSEFYLDELDALWVRFGLKSFLGGVPGDSFVALHVRDNTDYGEIEAALSERQAAQAAAPRKPWWRFW